MPDEHELTQLALPFLSRRSLMSWRRPGAGWRRVPTGDRGYAKSSRPVYHAGDRHRFSAIVQALSAQASHQRLLASGYSV